AIRFCTSSLKQHLSRRHTEINPISRVTVDPAFQHPVAHTFGVQDIACPSRAKATVNSAAAAGELFFERASLVDGKIVAELKPRDNGYHFKVAASLRGLPSRLYRRLRVAVDLKGHASCASLLTCKKNF